LSGHCQQFSEWKTALLLSKLQRQTDMNGRNDAVEVHDCCDCALLQCGSGSNKAARNDYSLVAGVPPAWKIAADTAASTETLYSRVAFILADITGGEPGRENGHPHSR